jgi:uncharacterized membrane protein YhaH (DUF805 family)
MSQANRYCRQCGAAILRIDSHFCPSCGAEITPPSSGAEQPPQLPSPTAASELPMVSFPQAVRLGFKNYFKFSGRSTRAEYWWWLLFTVLAGIVLNVLTITGTMGMVGFLFELATLVPSFALGARRLHDINRTGWWLLWFLGSFPMAAIGGGILLVSFFLLDNLLILTVLGFAMAIGFGILGIIGVIVLIVWAIKQGDEGLNKYGPAPRQPSSQQP